MPYVERRASPIGKVPPLSELGGVLWRRLTPPAKGLCWLNCSCPLVELGSIKIESEIVNKIEKVVLDSPEELLELVSLCARILSIVQSFRRLEGLASQ
jgi:hypothetical protein